MVAELVTVPVALFCALVPVSSDLVERYYSLRLFPSIQRTLTPVTNRVPVAVFDVLLIAVLCVAAFITARGVRQAWRGRSFARLIRPVVHLAAVAATLYLCFLGLWGFNYRRIPMTMRVSMDRAAPSPKEVLDLGVRAVEALNSLYAESRREPAGVEWQDADLQRAFTDVQRDLSNAPLAAPGRPKQTLLGFYFRWTGVDGMINPFGLEVLANPDLLPFERAFVTAHEWGHLAGYADESEANFVGWLTCMHGPPAARYGGWFFLYWQVSSELDAAERERLSAALAEGPREDVRAVIDRLQRTRIPTLQRASWQVYDQYLKANRVEAGIRSYGAVVTLILRTRFEDGWTPVRLEPAPPS